MLSLVIDEHVPPDLIRAVAALAGTQGYVLDIVTVREVGLDRTPDQRILEWAVSEGRGTRAAKRYQHQGLYRIPDDDGLHSRAG